MSCVDESNWCINERDMPETQENESHILLEWESSSRPFQPKSKEFYRTAGAFVLLFVVILLFIGEFLLIGVILAIMFALYAFSTVPPTTIKHKITNLGVQTGDYFHKWEEMYEFWFDQKYGQEMVDIKLLIGFPPHLQLMLGNVDKTKLKVLLSDHVPFRETPEKTVLDRMVAWFTKNFPLERTS